MEGWLPAGMDSSPGGGPSRVDRWGLTAVCLPGTMRGAGIPLGLEPSPLAAQSMGIQRSAGRKPNLGGASAWLSRVHLFNV